MARAPIVDPDRRAVGAEQPVGAVAEDVEAGRQVQRRREAGGELVEQRAEIALQLLALPEPEQLERGDEGVGRLGRRRRRCRRPPAARRTDRQQADPLAAADQRQQQRGAACRAAPADPGIWRSASATSVGARRANASVTQRRFVGAGHPRIGRAASSRPKPDVACRAPLRGLCSNSSEQRAAGRVERVLVQVRQQVGGRRAVRQQRRERTRGDVAGGAGGLRVSRGIDSRFGGGA